MCIKRLQSLRSRGESELSLPRKCFFFFFFPTVLDILVLSDIVNCKLLISSACLHRAALRWSLNPQEAEGTGAHLYLLRHTEIPRYSVKEDVAPVWRESHIQVTGLFFLQRALKDLNQPKTEWNFPTEAGGKTQFLWVNLTKTTTHSKVGDNYFSLGTLKKHSFVFVSDAEWRGRNSDTAGGPALEKSHLLWMTWWNTSYLEQFGKRLFWYSGYLGSVSF